MSASDSRARSAGWLFIAAVLAATALYGRALLFPVLVQDDFQILARSWTWAKTVDGLWLPNNEHAMPLGRLLTFAVVRLAGRPTGLPSAAVLAGVVGLPPALALTYLFVRRELGHPFYGLAALTLFGVSSVYQQAVYWFAASFSVYALDALLLALLAAQQFRQTGHLRWLLACVFCCAAAPCWFGSGVLAGPLCCLYLLPGGGKDKETRRQGDKETGRQGRITGRFIPSPCLLVSLSPCLLPLLGTAAFLAVSLPLTAPIILHLEHYRDSNALQAFRPLTGAWYTVRSVVDNLAFGAFGVTGVTVGPVAAPPIFAVLVAAGGWWAHRSPRRRLALLGAGLIFGSYLLIYSARATWSYDGAAGMFTPSWSRYHLQPQLGLTLLLCGGLPAWEGRWFRLDPAGRMSPGQTRALAWLLGVCFLVQAPRGLLCYYATNPRQAETLRLIEQVSDVCRQHRISTEAARRALGPLPMPESTTTVDGWEFLRGSDDPKDWSPEEVADMLREEKGTRAGSAP